MRFLIKSAERWRAFACWRTLILYYDAHPPYSLDISPCDFFLFGYLKAELRSIKLTSLHDLLNAIEEIITKIDIKVWPSVFESWIRRLSAVIECNGDYPIIY